MKATSKDKLKNIDKLKNEEALKNEDCLKMKTTFNENNLKDLEYVILKTVPCILVGLVIIYSFPLTQQRLLSAGWQDDCHPVKFNSCHKYSGLKSSSHRSISNKLC